MTESVRLSTCSIEFARRLRLQLAEPLASTNGMDLHREKRSPSGLTKESKVPYVVGSDQAAWHL